MKIGSLIFLCFVIGFLQSCNSSKTVSVYKPPSAWDVKSTVTLKKNVPARIINVKNVNAEELTVFAETLLGIPYQYGSMKIENGFDCSGFINYVFNHFKIAVPRTTIDFTNAGKEVSIRESKKGDIILFTGSDANSGIVGHMGIITENKKNSFWFIHAASGKGVMISSMNSYFIPRFVKVIQLFP